MDDVFAPLMPYLFGLAACSAFARYGGRLGALLAAVGALTIAWLIAHR